jgi:large subunit ribosomal protein L10
MLKEAVEAYGDATSLVAVSYTGISAEDAASLRKSLRAKNVRLRVVKNRIVQRAFAELGRGSFGDLLDTQVAVISSEDPVESSKAAAQLAREKNLELRGGWVDGRDLTKADVQYLASLPSKKQLFAQVAGLAAAPLRSLVGMLSAPYASLARALKAWNEKPERAAGQGSGGG